MIPVIMAGGSGTRLWPLSRTAFPKQFLTFDAKHTMLQQTVFRLNGLTDAHPIIISNEEHRFLVAEQLRQIDKRASILLEPVGRNTAPAIALAAFQAMAGNIDEPPVLLILAADHVIRDTSAFLAAVKALLPAVKRGKFGTLGIIPTEPATGYGYIRAGSDNNGLLNVEQFVEKPDAATAQKYLDTGDYFWNSGIFMIRADRYLEELKRFAPAIYFACEAAMANTKKDLDFVRIDKDAFLACPDDSIDYAVMEPLSALEEGGQVVVAPLNARWNDVGSWAALWEITEKDELGNVVLGSGLTILKDSNNSLVSTDDRLVTTLGIDNLVIVDTKDALLVAHRSRVQDVKEIVGAIKENGGAQHQYHREVYRPWGKYDSIGNGQGYQVKRIVVKPGAKLSLQMHHHRAEHWIVVSGTAKVTNGDCTFLVTVNESTYIPVGRIHCLENPGKVNLEMIEVQTGPYLFEDDIVRIEDKYGRA